MCMCVCVSMCVGVCIHTCGVCVILKMFHLNIRPKAIVNYKKYKQTKTSVHHTKCLNCKI